MPRWSRSTVALTAGSLFLVTALLLDVLGDLHISGVFATAAILASVSGRPRPTAAIAALAVAAAAASGLWHDTFGDPAWTIRLIGCLVSGVAAVGAAVLADRYRRATHHTSRLAQDLLDALAVELTGARTVTEVAEGFLGQAAARLGASSAVVHMLDEDDVMRPVTWVGRSGPQPDPSPQLALEADLPGAAAARSRTPLHFPDRAAVHDAFPALVGTYPEEQSLHVLPLVHDDTPIGLLSLTFPPDAADTADQRGLLESLAGALGTALVRAHSLALSDSEVQRSAILAEASRTLARSLDWDETLAEVRRLLVPRMSDWCALHLVREGTLETAALWHRDPDTDAWAQDMAALPVQTTAPAGVAAVVRTGQPQLVTFMSAELLDEAAVDEAHAGFLRRMGLVSAVIAPMRHGSVVGAVSLAHAESGRRYGEDDVTLLVDLASRVAIALDNAESFTRQSRRLTEVMKVAAAAQQAILAPPPPRIGPYRLSARYVSAADEAQVGGDLYEVVARGDRLRVLVGDVRGKGLGAVRTATIVLGGFRSVAALDVPVEEVARQLDKHVQVYLPDEEDFVTAALMDLDHDGSFSLVLCGHPAPVLVHDGRWRLLEATPTVPLGLGSTPVPTHGRLAPDDRLVLFTDGLLEARQPDGGFLDPEGLWALATSEAFADVLDSILDAIRLRTGGRLQDDLALLALELDAGTVPAGSRPTAVVAPPRRLARVLPAEGASVGHARSLVRTLLEDTTMAWAGDDAQLAVTEIITNALVHAGGEVRLTAGVDRTGLRVDVLDDSPHLPVRRDYSPVSATGRGLHLLDSLVTHWGATALDHGKTVWFEIQDPRGAPPVTSRPGLTSPVDDTLDVAVELRNVPLLMHAAWQEHVSTLLREYLLVRLDDDPDVLERHAQASDALNLLQEQIAAPDLGAAPDAVMSNALEPRVSTTAMTLSVPPGSVDHFATLGGLVDEALHLADSDPGRLLAPPTQPEIREVSRWFCREVHEQVRAGRSPEPWRTEEPARVTDPDALRIDGWDPGEVCSSPLALVATNEANVIVAVSRSALDALGYARSADLTGRPVTCLVPERYRQAHVAGTTLHAINGRGPLLGLAISVPVLRAGGEEATYGLTVESRPLVTGRRVYLAELTTEP